jgi:potassium-transporting ATPase KdpC subunit
MSLKKELRRIPSPAIRLAIISMILCGLIFPLVVTGFAQVLFPGQADGSIAHLGSNSVGSYLIAQNFSRPYFFQSRNSSLSASGVDPDITLQDAQAQISRISNATCVVTCITPAQLDALINQHLEGTFWIFGYPYVNVLKLNLALIQTYQTVYRNLDPSLFHS